MTPDTVIPDPPRKGCDETLPEIIAGMEPERIVYVSCDPATLARDCARFAALGYEVKQVVPFDLFPRTFHVETVVSFAGNAGIEWENEHTGKNRLFSLRFLLT